MDANMFCSCGRSELYSAVLPVRTRSIGLIFDTDIFAFNVHTNLFNAFLHRSHFGTSERNRLFERDKFLLRTGTRIQILPVQRNANCGTFVCYWRVLMRWRLCPPMKWTLNGGSDNNR